MRASDEDVLPARSEPVPREHRLCSPEALRLDRRADESMLEQKQRGEGDERQCRRDERETRRAAATAGDPRKAVSRAQVFVRERERDENAGRTGERCGTA